MTAQHAEPPDTSLDTSRDAVAASEPQLGQYIGSYRIVGKLGEGGMGAVFACVHDAIGRRAALKVLRRDIGHAPGLAVRFLNEARAANRVTHPGVVQIFDCGQLADGTLYLLMEQVDGITLHAHIDAASRAPVPVPACPGALGRDALPILQQLAGILATAHQQGIVHRDLKPSNVMVVADATMLGGARVRLLDFGLAKLLRDVMHSQSGADPWPTSPRTESGVLLGTPAYMAPEQATSPATVNDRADVYSLGVIAYQLLVGQLPITGSTHWALLQAKLRQAPRPLRAHDPRLPVELEQLVMSMLAMAATDRPSAAQVERELAAAVASSPAQPQRTTVFSRTQPLAGSRETEAPTAATRYTGRHIVGLWAMAAGLLLLSALVTTLMLRAQPLVQRPGSSAPRSTR